nr:MtN3 saliva-related transmembrane protein domain containing protein [Haemonchus contortus]
MDLKTFLQLLSCSAIVTTICLFLCGIPICIEILRRRTTQEISGVPFLMGLLGGAFWLRYGFLKDDSVMIIVNVVCISLFTVYCIFYLIFANNRCSFLTKLSFVLSIIGAMCAWIAYNPNINYLGIACMTFNILNFGAPLAGLGVVLRKRCCDSLPLPMCVTNLLVSSQWFLYGNIVQDKYIMAPNGIGMALAVFQLSLFLIFPRKENGKSMVSQVADFFTSVPAETEVDHEKGDRISTLTTSTGISIASGQTLMRKLSEALDRKTGRSGSFGAVIAELQQTRPRTTSEPEISKFKKV